MHRTDPDLKEHVIDILRIASIDSSTDITLHRAINREGRECSLLEVQQACAELTAEGRLQKLDVQKAERSRRYKLIRRNQPH